MIETIKKGVLRSESGIALDTGEREKIAMRKYGYRGYSCSPQKTTAIWQRKREWKIEVR